MIRWSPTGPSPDAGAATQSSERKKSNAGENPTPQAARWGSRSSGTDFAREMPALSTNDVATTDDPGLGQPVAQVLGVIAAAVSLGLVHGSAPSDGRALGELPRASELLDPEDRADDETHDR